MTPDGAIREAIVTGLAAVGILAFDQGVPISSPTPDLFAQIHSQGRTRTAVSKQNYEWMGSVTLSLVKLNQKGYISTVDLDEMDSEVVSFMDGIVLPGFKVQLSRFVRSTSDTIESPTRTIARRHVEYEIWVNRII